MGIPHHPDVICWGDAFPHPAEFSPWLNAFFHILQRSDNVNVLLVMWVIWSMVLIGQSLCNRVQDRLDEIDHRQRLRTRRSRSGAWLQRAVNARLRKSRQYARMLNKMRSETADFASGAATWQTRRNARVVSDSAHSLYYVKTTSSTKPKYIIQGGPKMWYLSNITLHCTRGITFFGPPCISSATARG